MACSLPSKSDVLLPQKLFQDTKTHSHPKVQDQISQAVSPLLLHWFCSQAHFGMERLQARSQSWAPWMSTFLNQRRRLARLSSCFLMCLVRLWSMTMHSCQRCSKLSVIECAIYISEEISLPFVWRWNSTPTSIRSQSSFNQIFSDMFCQTMIIWTRIVSGTARTAFALDMLADKLWLKIFCKAEQLCIARDGCGHIRMESCELGDNLQVGKLRMPVCLPTNSQLLGSLLPCPVTPSVRTTDLNPDLV